MLNIAVLLLFFALFAFMFLGKKENAFIWVFVSLVIFPPCIYFMQSPQVSPQQAFLYAFFALTLIWNRSALFEGIFKNPLRIPLLLLFLSLMASAVLNGDGATGMYNAFRYYMENYAYLIVAFIGGLSYKSIRLEDKWLYPIAVLCVLGVIEYATRSNFIFPIICQAFPYYDGYYDLASTVSASRMYRSRIFITTTHPTVLGSVLCCSLMMLTCRMKELNWQKGRPWIAWGGLLLLVALSGSRTAWVCSLIGLTIYGFMKAGIRLKFFIIVIVGFGMAWMAPKVIESFDVEGEGSSMSMRQEQMLFSYLQFMKSPIYGNGVRYTSKYVMERDTYNDRVTDEEIGGLESVVFFQLIDYGMIGFGSYFLLFLFAFIYFFRRRRFTHAQTGLLVTICFFIFACLSGEIGGNNTYAYMLMGYCMGAARIDEEDEEEEEEREEKRTKDGLVEISAEEVTEG